MFSGVWSPDKKDGFVLNEKTIGAIEQNRISTGDLRIQILHITENAKCKN
jgi:hypothetical protein